MSYLLQNLALLIWGLRRNPSRRVSHRTAPVSSAGRLVVTGETLVTIVTSAVIMVALTLFVNKTKVGHAMQAVSEDKGAAQLMGINVNATISLTFAIGSALAAVAGVLLCSAYPTLMPTTGAMPGIKAFVAAVFGGIGSIPGAMLGGVLYGTILYRKPLTFRRALWADLVVALICNIFLNTLWLSMMSGKAMMVLLPMRVLKNLIKWPVDAALFYSDCKTEWRVLGVVRMIRKFQAE